MMRTGRLSIVALLLCAVGLVYAPGPVRADAVLARQAAQAPGTNVTALPNREDSLKFAVLGDFGTGSREQYDLAAQMAKLHDRWRYEIVITVGDNLYGAERPQDFKVKFEEPYKPLLDAGVKFYATLGNHDAQEQRYYKLFNMEGKTYYDFKAPKQDVRFFVLDSNYPKPEQMDWIEKQLKDSKEDWKIVYFHHPLYSSGERHGSDTKLRDVLEPLFVKYDVSVVFTGHDHFYERVKLQKGIQHFVVGSGGQLRRGNIDRRSGLTASGFDTDLVFLAVEIDKDEMFFNAISRQGTVVDSGTVPRRQEQKK